jgi:hypothetical protein
MIMTFRHWLRVIGAFTAGIGLLCLPSIGRSPRSYGSGFALLSDTGSLMWVAVTLLVVGAVVFLVSFVGGE